MSEPIQCDGWMDTTIDGYNEYNMIEGYNDVIQWIQCDGWIQ